MVKSIFQHFNPSDKRLESASYTFTKYEKGYCKKNLEEMIIFFNFKGTTLFFSQKSNRNIVKSIFQHFNPSDKRLESASYTFTKYEKGYCEKNLEKMNIFLNFKGTTLHFSQKSN